MAWTDPKTWNTNELVTAANLNIHIRDNLKHYADTRYLSLPLNSAYYDSTIMSGFLTSATIEAAANDGLGSALAYIPYQRITFPDSGTTGVAWTFHVPHDYGGSPVLYFRAYNEGNNISDDKSGVFVAYVAGIDNPADISMLPTLSGVETGTNTGSLDTLLGVGLGQIYPYPGYITLTNTGGLAAGATAGLYLLRTPAAAGDTLAEDVGIIDVWLEYSPLVS